MPQPLYALVTGANRGIGLEIVRQLAKQGIIAILAARNVDKGRAAAEMLRADGITAPVAGLDVDDPESVSRTVAQLIARFGRIDVLVNNAAVLLDGPGGFNSRLDQVTPVMVRSTFETNVFGPLRMIQAVLPSMKANGYGRIVNLSSGAGQLTEMGAGFPAYRMSKSALNALTRTTAGEIGAGDIKINSACPGWVRTDMGGPGANRSVAEGADTAVWLATLPENGPTGGFFRDRQQIPW